MQASASDQTPALPRQYANAESSVSSKSSAISASPRKIRPCATRNGSNARKPPLKRLAPGPASRHMRTAANAIRMLWTTTMPSRALAESRHERL